MRVKISILILLTFSAAIISFIPDIVSVRMPTRDFVLPATQTHTQTLTSSGVVQQSHIREIYLETPVIAEAVYVEVGDRVEKDDLLISVDTGLTRSVISQGVTVKKETGDMDLSAYNEIADAYGFSLDDLGAIYSLAGDSASPKGEEEQILVPESVLAPISGTVTRVGISSGVLSQTATPVVTIADDSSFDVLVTVSESNIGKISIGMPVYITGPGFSGRTYTGYVSKIYPTATRVSSGSVQQAVVEVLILVHNPDSSLKDGFTAEAEIILGEPQQVLTVPYQVIRQDESNVEYLYVYEDGVARRRNIVTGVELTWAVEVTEGIGPDDIIMVYDETLSDGVAVALGGRVSYD